MWRIMKLRWVSLELNIVLIIDDISPCFTWNNDYIFDYWHVLLELNKKKNWFVLTKSSYLSRIVYCLKMLNAWGKKRQVIYGLI